MPYAGRRGETESRFTEFRSILGRRPGNQASVLRRDCYEGLWRNFFYVIARNRGYRQRPISTTSDDGQPDRWSIASRVWWAGGCRRAATGRIEVLGELFSLHVRPYWDILRPNQEYPHRIVGAFRSTTRE